MTKHGFNSFEPESKQNSSMWKHASLPSHEKARLSKPVGKVSIIFCDTRGMVLHYIVPAKTNVNSEYYAHLIWVLLQRAIPDKCPDLARLGFILHQDNAPVNL